LCSWKTISHVVAYSNWRPWDIFSKKNVNHTTLFANSLFTWTSSSIHSNLSPTWLDLHDHFWKKFNQFSYVKTLIKICKYNCVFILQALTYTVRNHVQRNFIIVQLSVICNNCATKLHLCHKNTMLCQNFKKFHYSCIVMVCDAFLQLEYTLKLSLKSYPV
jgi:hypothetical protein